MIYVVVFLLILFASFKSKAKDIQGGKEIIILGIILPLFLCTGYMCGSDWRLYEYEYNTYSGSGVFFHTETEVIYTFLVKVSKWIGLDFWYFNIMTKLVGYYIFLNLYKKWAGNNFGLIFWFPYFALFLWIAHPARNFVAIIIFMFALKYAFQRHFWKYVTTCVFAAGCHSTAFVMIPIYFYLAKRGNVKYYYDVIIIIATFFAALVLGIYLEKLVGFAFFSRMETYLTSEEFEGKQMSFPIFMVIIGIICVAIRNIKELRKKTKYADFLMKCALVYAFFFAIANLSGILFRLPLYFMLPVTVLVSYDCVLPILRVKRLVCSSVIVFSLYYMVHLTTKNHIYVPYTSYIEYMFQDKPSFNERENYNYIHTPYK